MKIHFCGAAETTTGSQHLLEVNGKRILLDCGMYQGHREEELRINREFPYFKPEEIDCVILSHAHIDHSGNLPNLVKRGFKGFIYTTYATRDLCAIMLADAARIQASDVNFLNKMDKRKGGSGNVAEVIYTEQDAETCMHHFLTLGYKMPFHIAPGITLTFYDAGHILGAAQIVLDIDDADDGKHKRLLFSGDIGRGDNELLRDPEAVPQVDIMLMECTYGGRFHEESTKNEDSFYKVIQDSMKRGGNVYIPSFAVERTQQLLYLLSRGYHERKLPLYQVYVDSPMAVSATEIFRIHRECFNEEVYRFLFEEQRDPFGFEQLHMVRTVTESQKLNNLREKAIIISASGMCEAGRILHHLKNGISRDNNTVLFVGYCAANTLGRRIMDGKKEVRILGDLYPVRARIRTMDSFSGHADHGELIKYFQQTGGPKSKVFLVHGEKECAAAMKAALAPLHTGEVHVAHIDTSVTA